MDATVGLEQSTRRVGWRSCGQREMPFLKGYQKISERVMFTYMFTLSTSFGSCNWGHEKPLGPSQGDQIRKLHEVMGEIDIYTIHIYIYI